MKNPARELSDLLERWSVPRGYSPHSLRTHLAEEAGETFATEHTAACRYLADVSRWIDRLEVRGLDVEPWRATIPRWQEAVFSVHVPWTTQVQGARESINADQLRILKGLAGAIDLAGGTLELSVDTIDRAISLVETSEEFVRAADDLSESMRLHLLALLADIRDALINGPADRVGPLVAEVVGTMTLATERVPEERRPRWRDLTKEWVFQYSVGFAAGQTLPVLTYVARAVGEIGS